ncbi:MAG: hypothetical protein H6613_15440 [Ignavibacteriales bacterium]|nr:hypothetical protein [Ignavibacteriales bacterium]
MVNVIETETEKPICPHCEKQLNNILAQKCSTTLGVRFIYFCDKCKKVLGVSHRKGFWMG